MYKIVFKAYHTLTESQKCYYRAMDTIFIQHLVLRGIHGAHEHEWLKPQEFVLDINANIDVSTAALSDNLEDTVNWTDLQHIAKNVVDGPKILLIERMAEIIAKHILAHDARITAVSVTVKKTEALVCGVPGVTITRTR